MKKTLLFAAIVSLLLCSCTSKEKKAKELISAFVALELDYPTTYKVLSFGTLDSVFSSLETDEEMEFYKREIVTNTDLAQRFINVANVSLEYGDIDEANEYKAKAQSYLDKAKNYQCQADEYAAQFKPQFIGWSMEHTYQYNTKDGIDKDRSRFYMDIDLTAVLKEVWIE